MWLSIPQTRLGGESVYVSGPPKQRDPWDRGRRRRDSYLLRSEGTYGGSFPDLGVPTRRLSDVRNGGTVTLLVQGDRILGSCRWGWMGLESPTLVEK